MRECRLGRAEWDASRFGDIQAAANTVKTAELRYSDIMKVLARAIEDKK